MSKDKTCFVIMPISDNPKYADGHFSRVYEHLVKPACTLAGFKPVRADDVINTNYIALDVIKRIVESDLAICDLSTQNPNVLYELGIRQAFNKPVVLIKDNQTKRIFDIQGFRDFQYDETLRIDNVEKQIETLSEIMNKTYSSGNEEINSLVALLSISPASIDKKTEISTDTNLILNAISNLNNRISNIENKRSKIRTLSDIFDQNNRLKIDLDDEEVPVDVGDPFSIDELLDLKKGDPVYHHKFGYGEISKVTSPENMRDLQVTIKFAENVSKTVLARFANLRKVCA